MDEIKESYKDSELLDIDETDCLQCYTAGWKDREPEIKNLKTERDYFQERLKKEMNK